MDTEQQQQQQSNPDAEQPSAGSRIKEQFKKVENNFNVNFLKVLFQVMEIVSDEEGEKERKMYDELKDSYTYWYDIISEDPNDMRACLKMYDAIGDHHELLKGRNSDVFIVNGDLFSKMFGIGKKSLKHVDTTFLYNELSDGSEFDDDDDDEEEQEDAKEYFWDSLLSLYRLCVLICVYLKMPLVKDLIDIIISNNDGLKASNVKDILKDSISGSSKTSKKIRRILGKLLKQKDSEFENLFKSFQKVISIVTPGNANIPTPAPMKTAESVVRVHGDLQNRSNYLENV